ncbi:putative transporter [Colletotrichum orbiculare MAFF 240422]|uniref:Transporter n=1 Tax=Colletotrichum orbiculare (strain 104-T / ATCC 96160 / CBS 514.97 / LARS 414 / MAFF 240422) TaxID=1213857 RepID=A0A484FZ64_COLOR|nr:putative transporter [Colletotrichum orbiculare MAFF 240422]
MIASRFFMLPGAGGASRSHLIHNRLWQHSELMIKQIMLGQEKISTAKMRVVGTIESLLLISDWHPRAAHFPTDTEGWDAVFIDTEYDREHHVFKPAKRASRMSWMLLGLATNLAYELGVLPHDHHQTQTRNVAPSSDELRKFRAQRLLYTYMTQTATKLGYRSVLLPESVAITASRSVTADGNVEKQRSWNAYMNAYLELTRLSKLASYMFFQSAAQLQSVLQNDNYPDLVEHFQASLSSWSATHALSLENVLEPLKDSLLVELHHLRACIGAIAIQAVVQRASGSDTSVARADGLASYMTAKDVGLLQEVISDSSMVLEIAAVSSFKTHLACATARIRLNVISASVFLPKAISLGSPATDVETALHTLDRCTMTFKAYPQDDMDFAMRYADLIDKHALNLKNSFVSSSGQPRGTSSGSNGTLSSLAISTGPVSDMEQPGFWRDFQFDSSLAPFGDSVDQLSQGFDIDSLNFLWNLSDRIARLDGMEEELGMSSTEYVTCVSILFVGYILGQIPSNMLITRVRPSWFMAGAMALWAVVSTLTAVAKDFKGLLLTRFFLGVTEAPFYPGALYMLAMFYTRQEIATRISILFTANICGAAFAGLIAIGGVITFIVSAASAFVLPDEPQNTRWLTAEERQLAHSRVASDTVELHENTSTWRGLLEASRDPRLWVLIFMQHFHMGASNFKNFFPTIVETLGFTRNVTLVLTCPPYLVSGVVSIAWAASCGHFNERVWHITVAKAVAVIGFVVACSTLNVGARYSAMCLFALGVSGCSSIILGWVSSTCGQTREKKAISLALVNTIATIGPIYIPVNCL